MVCYSLTHHAMSIRYALVSTKSSVSYFVSDDFFGHSASDMFGGGFGGGFGDAPPPGFEFHGFHDTAASSSSERGKAQLFCPTMSSSGLSSILCSILMYSQNLKLYNYAYCRKFFRNILLYDAFTSLDL